MGAAATVLAFGAAPPRRRSPGFHGQHRLRLAVRQLLGRGHIVRHGRLREHQQGRNAVSAGSTVVVCRGIYQTQVVVSKPLTLAGRPAP